MTIRHQAYMHDRAVAADLWAEFLASANDGNQWLYMLLDAAQDRRILPALENSLHTRACLFSEEQISSELKAVSPFLVKIKKIDAFVMWCLSEGLHQHWMIFFTSPEIHVSELKLHFKRFSHVNSTDGKQLFFRYYDPRVLPTFLAVSDQRDRLEFFRRCKKIWVPQVSPTGVVQFLELDAEGGQKVLDNQRSLFAQKGLINALV